MSEMGVLCDFHGTLVDANKAWLKAFQTYNLSDMNQIYYDIYHKVNRKIICARYHIDYDEVKTKYTQFLEVRTDILQLVHQLSPTNQVIIMSNSKRERLLRDLNFVLPNLDLNIINVLTKENGNKNDPKYIESVLDKHDFNRAYLIGNDIREDFNPSPRITNIFVPYKETIMLNKSL